MHGRRTIGIFVDYLAGDYQLGLVQGAQEACREADANLLIIAGRALSPRSPLDGAQNEIYARISKTTVDGVVLASGSIAIHSGPLGVVNLIRPMTELAFCSIGVEVPGVPSLLVDNRQGMRKVVDHLIEAHKRQRVAYIRGPLASEEANDRYQGYVDALVSHGIEPDPRLVEVGDFWIYGGAEAARTILDRQCPFDALVAANDYMALAALDVLRKRGVRVPQDVQLAGFDDVPTARTSSPALTTVRQPIQALGHEAVNIILRQLNGEAVPERKGADVDLLIRQSCGCGYRVQRAASSRASARPSFSPLRELNENRVCIQALLRDMVNIPVNAFDGWAERLLHALEEELSGAEGRFISELGTILDRAMDNGEAIEQFHGVIGVLRTYFRRAVVEGPHTAALDDLWHAAILVVGTAMNRSYVRRKLVADEAQDVLRVYLDRLSTALDYATLTQVLREMLPVAEIASAAMSLYEDDTRATMRRLFVVGAAEEAANGSFASNRLAPPGFFATDHRWTHIVLPLTFETEHLGVAVFEAGADELVYRQLRGQIGASLKGAALHQAIVQQTTLRERAEREQLLKETIIAQHIQTAILPSKLAVDGLDLAAVMLPAADVGGDYYDVLPTANGCWIGIGDVSGHGLLAGMLMLMLQSMITGMVELDPAATPAKIVRALNAALFKSIHDRLERDNYATLTLFRYERSGRLTFAGRHEDFPICRASTGRCERVPTGSVWTAVVPDVVELTRDGDAQLEDQDLLVLYTDGVIEAMNAHHEQYGFDRFIQVIEESRSRPVGEICAAVVAARASWASSQTDDVSIVIGRFTAPANELRVEGGE